MESDGRAGSTRGGSSHGNPHGRRPDGELGKKTQRIKTDKIRIELQCIVTSGFVELGDIRGPLP